MVKVPLNKADTTTRQLAKKWIFLPQRTSNELVYILRSQGDANIPRMGNLCDIMVITQAFCLLMIPW